MAKRWLSDESAIDNLGGTALILDMDRCLQIGRSRHYWSLEKALWRTQIRYHTTSSELEVMMEKW